MKIISLAAALMAVSATAALAQSGTVNSYTSADAAKAKAAVQAAGFTPGDITSAQAGNFFVAAKKDGATYVVTVTPDGHVYAGPPFSGPTTLKP